MAAQIGGDRPERSVLVPGLLRPARRARAEPVGEPLPTIEGPLGNAHPALRRPDLHPGLSRLRRAGGLLLGKSDRLHGSALQGLGEPENAHSGQTLTRRTANESKRHTSGWTTSTGRCPAETCPAETCPGGTQGVEQTPRDKQVRQGTSWGCMCSKSVYAVEIWGNFARYGCRKPFVNENYFSRDPFRKCNK